MPELDTATDLLYLVWKAMDWRGIWSRYAYKAYEMVGERAMAVAMMTDNLPDFTSQLCFKLEVTGVVGRNAVERQQYLRILTETSQTDADLILDFFRHRVGMVLAELKERNEFEKKQQFQVQTETKRRKGVKI